MRSTPGADLNTQGVAGIDDVHDGVGFREILFPNHTKCGLAPEVPQHLCVCVCVCACVCVCVCALCAQSTRPPGPENSKQAQHSTKNQTSLVLPMSSLPMFRPTCSNTANALEEARQRHAQHVPWVGCEFDRLDAQRRGRSAAAPCRSRSKRKERGANIDQQRGEKETPTKQKHTHNKPSCPHGPGRE